MSIHEYDPKPACNLLYQIQAAEFLNLTGQKVLINYLWAAALISDSDGRKSNHTFILKHLFYYAIVSIETQQCVVVSPHLSSPVSD